jgi:type I restriction enzyme S subunit
MFKAASYAGHKLCWPEDLVINSLWAWANGLGFSRQHGIVSTAYGVYRLREPYRALWKYLHLALRCGAYDWQFHVRSKGIWKSRLQLTDWSFLDMPLILPPATEAAAISVFAEEATTNLDAAIEHAYREILLLREYRTRLIADVVTGKLDVREAAARLPDEAEKPEPLDESEPAAEGDDEPADGLDADAKEAEE